MKITRKAIYPLIATVIIIAITLICAIFFAEFLLNLLYSQYLNR